MVHLIRSEIPKDLYLSAMGIGQNLIIFGRWVLIWNTESPALPPISTLTYMCFVQSSKPGRRQPCFVFLLNESTIVSLSTFIGAQ